MNILVIGSGGREHAFAQIISKSPLCTQLFVAPGNAGTATLATNIDCAVTDFEKIKQIVSKSNIEMVVVGPEDPLVQGIVDFFEKEESLKSIPIIGPGKKGAQLEGSKEFAKQFMQRHQIPTAAYQSFTAATVEEGKTFLTTLTPPYVLKADGLAAGKGVVILNGLKQAQRELEDMLVGQKFGAASQKVVIEEFLDGIELSVFVLTDGKNYKILPEAKDYKRIGEGDTGLNTGGMGAISPVPFADSAFMAAVEDTIVKPTIMGLQNDGMPYKGFIFIGLIKVAGNLPKVIEYNIRMGDPETEVVLPRLKSDLVSLLQHTYSQSLDSCTLETDSRSATTVIAVSGGYPEHYEKGHTITFDNSNKKDVLIFHAGTKLEGESVVTNGGRVVACTALAPTYQEALQKSYDAIESITFKDKYYRKDIGFDL